MIIADELKGVVLAAAQECDPAEMCGLLYVAKGRQHFMQCKNIAATPDEHFIIDSTDYQAAEDCGEIIAIVHSHPATPPYPSPADRIACNRCGVPYVIVNPKTKQWGECTPSDYELPYIGRQFSFGIVDCYSLVRDWYQREWNITLDDFNRRDRFWERGENLYVDNYKSQGFRQVPKDEMQYGDLILMQLGSDLPNHGAIYIGDQRILHHVQARLSSMDVYGGYWWKNTAMVLRHESH